MATRPKELSTLVALAGGAIALAGVAIKDYKILIIGIATMLTGAGLRWDKFRSLL